MIKSLFFLSLIFVSILAQTPESVGLIKIKDVSKNLEGTTVNSAGVTVRSETYDVNWPGDELLPTVDNTFIGIRSLDIQSQEVDFTVELVGSAYSGQAAAAQFQVTAGAGTNIALVEHFMLVTFDPRVIVVNYDFGTDAAFASTFSTGTDANLVYNIPYTPAVSSLFTTGATAYVSLTRIKFDPLCTTYKVDATVVQVTSSSVQVRIDKTGNTLLQALKGQILIVSSAAASTLGFATTTVTTSSFAAGTVNQQATGTLAATAGYYGAPNMFFFLKGFNFEDYINFRSEGELSLDSGDVNFVPLISATQATGSTMVSGTYRVLTFCPNGKDCKTSSTFSPEVMAGETQIQNFMGYNLATSTTGDRDTTIQISFKRFFPFGSSYTNFGAGVIAGDSTGGFSVNINGMTITEKGLKITIKAFNGVAISKLKVSYIVSISDGLLISTIDFDDNAGNLANTQVGLRNIDKNLIFPFASDVINPSIYVIFNEVGYQQPTSDPIYFTAVQNGPLTTGMIPEIPIRATISGPVVFTVLQATVLIYDTSTAASHGIDIQTLTIPATSGVYAESTTQLTPNLDSVYVPYVFTALRFFSLPCSKFTLGAKSCIHEYYLGGVDCKMQWLYGLEDACIGSTFEYVAMSFRSYTQTNLDTRIFQNSGRICMDGSFGGGTEYAIVVTDDSKWNGIFRFNRVMRKLPRIVQTNIPTVSATLNLGIFTMPTASIGASGFYTINILKSTASSVWHMAGFTTEYMHDFYSPGPTNTPEVPETAAGNFGYSGADLSQSIGSYKTLIATRLVTHDQMAAFSCVVRVGFTGVIRSLYVNSQFILAGSSVDPATSITMDSEVSVSFAANLPSSKSAVTVTVFGFYLKITSLDFTTCVDGSGNSIYPTFSTFLPSTTAADYSSQTFYVKKTDITCGSGCRSCKDATTCYECLDSHFLLGSSCVYNCNDPTYFVAAKKKFCRSKFANLGIKLGPTTYSGGAISFDIIVNPTTYSYGALTMVYPKAIQTANYPLIIDDGTKPIALVEGPSDGAVLAIATQDQISIARTINVENIASAGNTEVKLITYNIYPNFFSYFTILSANPKSIGYRQSTSYGTAVSSMTLSDTYQAHAIVEAPSGGDLTVEFSGQLEVLLNHVTVIFSATFATKQSYTLERSLPTGFSYLIFKGTGSNYFSFSIDGSGVVVYNPVSHLYEETVTIPVSSVTGISNCYNGDGTTCRSCLATYYLSMDESQCISDCTTIDGTDITEERICKGDTTTTPPPGPNPDPDPSTDPDPDPDPTSDPDPIPGKILPVPAAIEALQGVEETRQISNEIFSVVSSIGFQGVHSIRSQTVQGPLGYFMFINIKFPLNYIQFAAKSQDSAYPNPWGPDENEDEVNEAYEQQSNIDTYLEDQSLAANIGEILLYLGVCILIIPVYEGIAWMILKNKRKNLNIKSKWYYRVLQHGSVSLRWSFLMNQFISKYQDITFFVFLGIYNAGRGENTSPGNTVGSVFGFILVWVIAFGLFFLIRILFKQFKDYSEEDIEKEKFRNNDYLLRQLILYKDLKKDNLMSLLYTFFVLLRVLGFCFCVIFISSVVGIQLAFLNISSFLIVAYLLVYKPFDEAHQLKLTLAYELDFYVGVLAATILQIYMSAGGDNHAMKSGFGYAIIAADVGMTILNFVSFFIEIKEYAEIGFEYTKKFYQTVRNRKVMPISPAETPEAMTPINFKNPETPSEIASPSTMKRFSKFDNGDFTSQELLSPGTSMSIPKLAFVSSINDPKRPSFKDPRHSLLRDQPLSILEAKEENDILIKSYDFKSPKEMDRSRIALFNSSPEHKNQRQRRRLSTRDPQLSVSKDRSSADDELVPKENVYIEVNKLL